MTEEESESGVKMEESESVVIIEEDISADLDVEFPETETPKKRTFPQLWTVFCCVKNCQSRPKFTFPSRNFEQQRLWLKAVLRGNPDFKLEKKTNHICGDHFYTGRPNPTKIHPDYVPSIFPWNENRRPKTQREKLALEAKLKEIEDIVQMSIRKVIGIQ